MSHHGMLIVKNWERFQHYKDRNPPWIKLYSDLLTDYEFSCLQDSSKAHLLLIWILSSKYNGIIPNDPQWIARMINAKQKIDIKALMDHGFLAFDPTSLEQDDSNVLATCYQNDSSVLAFARSRETEKRRVETDSTADSIAIPPELDDPDFRQMWFDEWIPYRREIKKPLTARAAKMALKALTPFGPGWACRRITKAIASGWQGLVFDNDKPEVEDDDYPIGDPRHKQTADEAEKVRLMLVEMDGQDGGETTI